MTYKVEQDYRTRLWYAETTKDGITVGIDIDGKTFTGIAVGADRAFTTERKAYKAVEKHKSSCK